MNYSDFIAGVTESKNGKFDLNSTFIPGQEPQTSKNSSGSKSGSKSGIKKLSKWFSCLSVPKVPEDSRATDSYIIKPEDKPIEKPIMKLSKSRKSSVWSISRKSTKTILTNENPGNISRLLDPKMTYDGRMNTMATNNSSDEFQSDSGISFYSTSMSSAGLKRIRRKSAHLEKFEVLCIL